MQWQPLLNLPDCEIVGAILVRVKVPGTLAQILEQAIRIGQHIRVSPAVGRNVLRGDGHVTRD